MGIYLTKRIFFASDGYLFSVHIMCTGGKGVEVVRIGEKLVSRRKLFSIVDNMLNLRSLGIPQQEVARRLQVDRTLVSRLECAGEIHKGERIAVLGFPIANKKQVEEALLQEGVEFVFLLSEEERWEWVQKDSGTHLLDKIFCMISQLRSFDLIIIIGSDRRIDSLGKILDCEVVGLEIGQSPIQEDKTVPIEVLVELVRRVKGKQEEKSCETGSQC